MKRARVLLVPSLSYEGFPLVMVEALAVGCPIIASRIGGLPEIAEENVAALFHEPGNASQLQGALQYFATEPRAALAIAHGCSQTLPRPLHRGPQTTRCCTSIYRGMLAEVIDAGTSAGAKPGAETCSPVVTDLISMKVELEVEQSGRFARELIASICDDASRTLNE